MIVTSVSFSKDSKLMATGSADSKIIVWNCDPYSKSIFPLGFNNWIFLNIYIFYIIALLEGH